MEVQVQKDKTVLNKMFCSNYTTRKSKGHETIVNNTTNRDGNQKPVLVKEPVPTVSFPENR